MSIPIASGRLADLPVFSPSAQTKNTGTRNLEEGGGTSTSAITATGKGRVQASAQLNSSIVQSSLSLNTQNEPLGLVLKSAITGINERLAPEFGPDAIQNAVGQDNSPEGTAGRIVALSTAFFSAFKEQNPELSEDAAAQKFLDTIKGGIEQGFKEAREILAGLNVLNGDVASNIDKTFDLVQQGLAKFAASLGIGGDAAENQNTSNPPANGKDGSESSVQSSQSRIDISIRETRSVSISVGSTRNN
jgi:hypothetical protein